MLVEAPDRLSRYAGLLIDLLLAFHQADVRVEFSSQEGRDDFRLLTILVSGLAELCERKGTER